MKQDILKEKSLDIKKYTWTHGKLSLRSQLPKDPLIMK